MKENFPSRASEDIIDPLGQYIQEIHQIQLLSPEREMQLAETIQIGRVGKTMYALANGAVSVSVAGHVSEIVARGLLLDRGLARDVAVVYKGEEVLGLQPITYTSDPEKNRLLTDFALLASSEEDIRKKTEKLSCDENVFRAWEKEGKEAQDILVGSNLRFVVSIAKTYVGHGLDLLDLIQEGNSGLIRAVKTFDPARKNRFLTYARHWIQQRIVGAIHKTGNAIRIPVYSGEIILEIKKVQQKKEATGQVAAEGDIMNELALSAKAVKRLELISRETEILSLDLKIAPDSDFEFGDTIADNRAQSLEDAAIQRITEEELRDAVRMLSEIEQKVISLKFGYGLTHERIGRELGKKRQEIYQIVKRAEKKLRETLGGTK